MQLADQQPVHAWRVMFVVGAREKGKAQLWVDRDDFAPARIAIPGAVAAGESGGVGSSGAVELRFFDYDVSFAAGRMPRVIETFVDGARVDTFSIESFESGVAVPAKAFDRDGLSSTIK